jgi:hypothetical protein
MPLGGVEILAAKFVTTVPLGPFDRFGGLAATSGVSSLCAGNTVSALALRRPIDRQNGAAELGHRNRRIQDLAGINEISRHIRNESPAQCQLQSSSPFAKSWHEMYASAELQGLIAPRQRCVNWSRSASGGIATISASSIRSTKMNSISRCTGSGRSRRSFSFSLGRITR